MNETNKLKLNLQHFANNDVTPATFNPDNVMMHEHKEGELLNNFTKPVLREVMETSKIMQLGKYQEMDGTEKDFVFWADKPGAYWVGEGQKIETSKATWLEAKMRAYKLGVILPVTKEFLNYTYSDFFEAMKPMIAEAFARKFDEAGILNVGDNPFNKSIEQSVQTAGNVINGEYNEDNLLDLEALIENNDYDPNAFISKRTNRRALSSIVDSVSNERLFEKGKGRNAIDTLDGLPVVNLKSPDYKENVIYTGDFNQLFYGIPQRIEYKIDDSSQLSTIKDGNGEPINLFERDMLALRATMHVAVHIADDKAFAKFEGVSTKPETVTPKPETV
ncbi:MULTISPECIES: phage major capsid protein [Staphylococcus]|jgi:HK97 family phage major capsid protein|nr:MULTISPECIES: phage major capsid protein [Staphylococcus]DAZ18443.1 MAG TPA: Major capsid protein [Caudoviricetes sp.]MBC3013634.1 phage major capsid protein [Staphylococcus haemolyticus]MBC3101948.1 phage major capsid protein [Staphylococcus haemolyticus]MBC3114876.1 phage major capsid protein [Staphylococcus haemolyticus]MBC3124021.1 phage major capsid protein [Staphylococcus haemolyticus]